MRSASARQPLPLSLPFARLAFQPRHPERNEGPLLLLPRYATRSKIPAAPMPPPMHIVTMP
jgi:hypothetical protein